MLTTLVDTDALARHLTDPRWVVVDCRFTLTDAEAGRRAYDAGHIPGARYAHLNEDLSSCITRTAGATRYLIPRYCQKNLAPGVLTRPGRLSCTMTASAPWPRACGGCCAGWGTTRLRCSTVVIQCGCARKTGHERQAIDTSRDICAASLSHAPGECRVRRTGGQGQRVSGNGCARAEERYRGDIEPLDKVAGHIPGAVNAPYEDNLDIGGEFLPAEELRERYLDLLGGVTPDQAIHMCGSGVTACHNVLAMEHAGLAGAKLYAGSWSEWITDPNRPVAKGE